MKNLKITGCKLCPFYNPIHNGDTCEERAEWFSDEEEKKIKADPTFISKDCRLPDISMAYIFFTDDESPDIDAIFTNKEDAEIFEQIYPYHTKSERGINAPLHQGKINRIKPLIKEGKRLYSVNIPRAINKSPVAAVVSWGNYFYDKVLYEPTEASFNSIKMSYITYYTVAKTYKEVIDYATKLKTALIKAGKWPEQKKPLTKNKNRLTKDERFALYQRLKKEFEKEVK